MTGEERAGLEGARAEARRRGVGSYGRHVFLCTGPDCCTPEEGAAAWARLKRGVGELNARGTGPPIYRTKVGCLRICESGPVAVVYPEGRWYAGLDAGAIEHVITEDLGRGECVGERLIGENPLSPETAGYQNPAL